MKAAGDVYLPWPFFVIDFEASSLSDKSYPIEVGIVGWQSADVTMEGWSALIRPPAIWQRRGDWSNASAAVHGIKQAELQNGISPAEVIEHLNQFADGAAVYCDGGDFDRHWLETLERAAGRQTTFELEDIGSLKVRCGPAVFARFEECLSQNEPPHRAREDAARLMQALVHGLDIDVAGVEEIAQRG